MFKKCMAQQPTTDPSKEITPDVSELIAELKHDIAAIALEMQAKFNQQETLKLPTNQNAPLGLEYPNEPVWVFLVRSGIER